MRPLPGFRFDARPPGIADVLPRMDVAMFVGFASRGPVHKPVSVDDVGQFAAIFGDDAPLAWDAERGEQVFACLAPAVRGFFRNGGRRCWIVRVADRPVVNFFGIPGVLRLNDGLLGPAFARARSAGSWSDGLRAGAALSARPMAVSRIAAGPIVHLPVAASELQVGDVIRVSFRDGREVFFPIARVALAQSSPPSDGPLAEVTGDPARTVWFESTVPAGLPGAGTSARIFTEEHAGRLESPPSDEITGPLEATSPAIAVLNPPAVWTRTAGVLELDLDMPLERAPAPGSMVRIDAGGRQGWMSVEQFGAGASTGPSPRPSVRATGRAWWRMPAAPAVETLQPRGAELLQLTLAACDGREEAKLHGLGLARGHGRFWNAVQSDDEVFDRHRELPAGAERGAPDRFPLCGDGTTASMFVPLGVGVQVQAWLGPVRRSSTPLERDGLARFDAGMFLDPDLAQMGTASVAAGADFIRYERRPPRPLRGIYTAFDVDEVTMIAAPDAVHRGWSQREIDPPAEPPQTPPPVRREWWHFLDCPHEDSELQRVSHPEWGQFLRCDIRLIAAPRLHPTDVLSETGTFTLSWESEPADRFVLEESASEDFAGDRETVYSGSAARFTMYGRRAGIYYYRVRAEIGDQTSDWSNSRVVRVGPRRSAQLETVEDYSPVALLDVHRALLRMSASRGDLLAVLALPEHYRERDAIAHVSDLRLSAPRGIVPPLQGEIAALSYGALYHPWVIGRDPLETSDLRRVPPDGVACGLLARRTLARGAWIAAANEPIRGAVALHPRVAVDQHQTLQDAQINVIRQEPRGMVALNADTLSHDRDLRPINVRRLLSLLRRQALRLGATYVFEPHDDAFRRLVRRGFEGMLDQMFLLGAFAGDSAASSYQVVISPSLNNQHSVDQGRLIVELRVAPSLPLTFLTVRLVQSGERGFVTEAR